MITTRLDPELGVRLNNLYYVAIFLASTVCSCFNSQITVFMTIPGILTVLYVRTLHICLNAICDIDSCSLYGSLLFYSIDNNVVDYDIYHCLFNMLYVLWLAIFSNLCRGGGGLYCCVFGAIMHYYY